jgi:uncharacterized protein YjbI with pentapeptide repeats
MAKETGQESKDAGQDAPLYKAWLSNGLEHLSRVFGYRLARVLVAFAILLLSFLAVSFVYGVIWYLSPIFSANDKLSTTDRRDLVQGFASVAQAAAVGLAGAVGLVGLLFTWQSLRQAYESQAQTQKNTQRTLDLTEQGQITERFTRAIDQLGAADEKTTKPKLEIRLGGIYALERIAIDSPKRDYGAVMEVLTAYVRENTHQAPRPSKGSSEAASTSNEAPAEAEEGAKQAAAPEPLRPTADIQAILDVVKRTQDRVLEEDRTRLDLHEANLQGAYLIGAYLQEANLYRANLQGAYLEEANLKGAYLKGANLKGADLQETNLYTNLQGADLQDAKLQDANLKGAYLVLAILIRADLQEANLYGADLGGADLGGGNLKGAFLKGANLQDTNLQDTNLQDTNLQDATLYRANLQDANLQGANLQDANLQDANLKGAKLTDEYTDEQLADTLSLEGATMPDGQTLKSDDNPDGPTYEDWLIEHYEDWLRQHE